MLFKRNLECCLGVLLICAIVGCGNGTPVEDPVDGPNGRNGLPPSVAPDQMVIRLVAPYHAQIGKYRNKKLDGDFIALQSDKGKEFYQKLQEEMISFLKSASEENGVLQIILLIDNLGADSQDAANVEASFCEARKKIDKQPEFQRWKSDTKNLPEKLPPEK